MMPGDNQWLIRVAIADRPGALAQLATVLSVHDVNLLRIDVVSRDDVAVDDVWVELAPGGRMESLELVLRRLPGVSLRAVLPRVPPDDPVEAMASACAALAGSPHADGALVRAIEGACLVGRADTALLTRLEPDGSLLVLAGSTGSGAVIAAHEPSLAREVIREGVALTVPGSYPWAPASIVAAAGALWVAAVPLSAAASVYGCLLVTRSRPMGFEGGELARLTSFGAAVTVTLERHGLAYAAPAPLELQEPAVALLQ